jgi:plastocyanin
MLNRYPPNALEFGIQVDPRASKPYRLSETTVIYLESEETHVQGRYTPPSRHAVLDQTGLKFHPQVLPILAGTTVDFPNGDPVFHNVFSYSQSREFDLGRYPMGDSRSVTFSLPGVVRVYCDIHADMNATILVLDNPYFATPNDEGSFTIPNIPAGRYRLNVWHGRDVAVRRTVVITSGETTTVSFTS